MVMVSGKKPDGKKPHHHRPMQRCPTCSPFIGYPAYLWGVNPYAYYAQSYSQFNLGSCCFDEAAEAIRCQNPSMDGAPAHAMQLGTYQGQRVAYVSSPAFSKPTWVWVCAKIS
jgi:hypothetical protein